MLNAMLSRTSGGSCSHGPWKEEMYRQCLYGVRESVWDSVSSADNQVFCRAYLLRHITSAGVDGSEVVCRDAVEGDVNSLDGAVSVDGLECPSGTSSVAVPATEAFDAFFLAIRVSSKFYVGRRRGV